MRNPWQRPNVLWLWLCHLCLALVIIKEPPKITSSREKKLQDNTDSKTTNYNFSLPEHFCVWGGAIEHFCVGGGAIEHFSVGGGAIEHPLPPNCGQALRCQYQSPYRPNGAAASPDTQKKEKAKNSCPAVFFLFVQKKCCTLCDTVTTWLYRSLKNWPCNFRGVHEGIFVWNNTEGVYMNLQSSIIQFCLAPAFFIVLIFSAVSSLFSF